MSGPFYALSGYINDVWENVLASLSYVNTTLSTLSVSAELTLAQAIAQTLRNSRDAIDANQISNAAATAYSILGPTLAISSGLDPVSLALITNRINALRSFALATVSLQPVPVSNPSAVLATGNPSIADPLFLDYLVSFSAETPPAGLIPDTFAYEAQSVADAWSAYATALAGLVSNVAIDQINYMAAASQSVADSVANIAISPLAGISSAWNSIVALPAILSYLDGNVTNPTSAVSQQAANARYIIGESLYAAYVLVVNLGHSLPTVVNTVTVRNNDSLMAIAARELGDYTQWQAIAQANNLIPPYIGPVALPGIAVWGQLIYLPTTSGGQANSQSNVTPAAYEATFLGTDIWYGPINQDMLPWTGDFLTISGNQNLAFSLGRRLQTTLGTLIFHSNYGSRIPPEIGNVTTQDTAGHLGAYTESALASDPRVAEVLSVNVNVLTSWAINIQGTVLPKGLTGNNYNVNVVAQMNPIVAGLQ